MKRLQAHGTNVVVKPLEESEKLYGSIIVPDMGKERPELGEVMSVGPGRQSEFGKVIKPEAKIGNIVLVPKIGSIKVDFEGQEYFLVQDREILATVVEQKEI